MNFSRLLNLTVFGFVCAFLVSLLHVSLALAQQAQTASSTMISVNDLLAPWMPLVVSVVTGFFLALLGLITAMVKRYTGIEIEKAHMETLQKSIENAAGKVVMIVSDKMKDARFDARHPAILQAIEYVNKSAADSVAAFDITPNQLAEKIIAKVGVITAPDSSVSPKDITPPPPNIGGGA